jgi:hypothetical protein
MSVEVITCEIALLDEECAVLTTYLEDLCFGNNLDAIRAPEYKAPIIKAMDSSLPAFVGFKHSSLLKEAVMNCPPKLSKFISPATAGLVDLRQVCSISCPASYLTIAL